MHETQWITFLMREIFYVRPFPKIHKIYIQSTFVVRVAMATTI